MHNIIHHNNLNSVNTFNSNLKHGDINPLLRKSYKQLVNINSRFRKNYATTTSTNFGFNLSTPVKKVVTMKVCDVILPKMVYSVSQTLGSNNFRISNQIIDLSNTGTVITIPSGSYSPEDMVTAVNLALLIDFSNINLQYNSTNGKMSFVNLFGQRFSLDFTFNDTLCNQFSKVGSNLYKDQMTLGWLLGFRKDYKYRTPANLPICQPYHECGTYIRNIIDYLYIDSNKYTAEALYDSQGSRYFLLAVNDYQNNHNIVLVSSFQEETLSNGNLLAKISSECCKCSSDEHVERVYFGPTDISKLEITLYDEFGRIVDLNNSDYSFTLELEVLYDL